MSDIEKIKAFHQVSSFVDAKTRELLIDQLNLRDANLEKRLPGIRVEDEFALILFFLNTAKHIVTIDETTAALTHDSCQCDYWLHLKSGAKLLVEVKSNPSEKFSISIKNLAKRIEFAKDMGFELYFALNLNNIWAMYPATYLQINGGKVDLATAINDSEFYSLLGSSAFLVPKDISIRSLYSKSAVRHIGIGNGDYGNLIEYDFFYQDNLVLSIRPDSTENLIHSLALEHWHDYLSKNMTTRSINEDQTEIIKKFVTPVLTPDYNYFLSSISHILNEHYVRHDTTSFLHRIQGCRSVDV